jgi:Zn-dependent M28 family amino/carboxypeptidase
MQSNLGPFTLFQNRFYNSSTGVESSLWLQETVQNLITESGATGASVKAFPHTFPQNSVIATIPGLSNATIVLGAHQDSVNWADKDQEHNRAPGADDDGSGSITILEALRVLLEDPDIKAGKAANTVEFHWYAAEEVGLLGSEDVWQAYKKEGRIVKGLLQQDMTGYSKGTTDKGKPEAVGVITDFVDTPLTEFIKSIIDAVSASSISLLPTRWTGLCYRWKANSGTSTVTSRISSRNADMHVVTTRRPLKLDTPRPLSSSRTLEMTARIFTLPMTLWRRWITIICWSMRS